MERWVGKTALVTGAASGIGEAITTTLLKERVNVVGVDLQFEELWRIAGNLDKDMAKFYTLRCDVTKDADVAHVFALTDDVGGVDIMVNNVGIVDYTPVIESDRKAMERLLNINVLGTATCISQAVRSMRQRNVEGHIFNINSILGHEIPTWSILDDYGKNGWNLYPASKHATVALTHTVRRELAVAKAPIRITSISPGLVRTNISRAWLDVQAKLNNMIMLDPQDIADGVIYALSRRPEVQITELTIRSRGEM